MSDRILGTFNPFDVKFIETTNELQRQMHQIAVDKGWWDQERDELQLDMLIVTEVAEMSEAARMGNLPSEKIPEFSSCEEEAADILIRLMDKCEKFGWRLGAATIAKRDYNKTRPHRHGGKRF